MKNRRELSVCVVALIVLLALFAGCGRKPPHPPDAAGGIEGLGAGGGTVDGVGDGVGDAASGYAGGGAVDDAIKGVVIDTAFTLSGGIDENGFWEGVRALDHVELFDYRAVQISRGVVEVSEDSIEQEIDNFLFSFPDRYEIMDRAVEEGDLVNIDCVGSIGGVELENLSTKGMGEDVVAGSEDFIDDFLTQIIGHYPGDVFNVEVTYPEDYGKDELNGKDAVFVTTINYIVVESAAELNDVFVMENLSGIYGWTSVPEMVESIRINLRNMSIYNTIFQLFTTEVLVRSVPKQLMDYQIQYKFVEFMRDAESRGMTLEEYVGSDLDEVANNYYQDIREKAVYCLVSQAIAEDVGLSVSEADLKAYAAETTGSGDYSVLAARFGLPYLKQAVLYQKVAEHIVDNAELIDIGIS